MTSEYESNAICVTTTGSPLVLPTVLSLTKPATTDNDAFYSSAASRFIDYLGFSSCEDGGSAVVDFGRVTGATPSQEITPTMLSPSDNLTTTPITSSLIPTSTSDSKSTDNQKRLVTAAKVSIGVFTPILGIAAILGVVLYLRKKGQRKPKKGEDSENDQISEPYFQQKPELEDEGNRLREMEAIDRRCEMDGDSLYEMQAEETPELPTHGLRTGIPSLALTHELVGEEFARELGVH